MLPSSIGLAAHVSEGILTCQCGGHRRCGFQKELFQKSGSRREHILWPDMAAYGDCRTGGGTEEIRILRRSELHLGGENDPKADGVVEDAIYFTYNTLDGLNTRVLTAFSQPTLYASEDAFSNMPKPWLVVPFDADHAWPYFACARVINKTAVPPMEKMVYIFWNLRKDSQENGTLDSSSEL